MSELQHRLIKLGYGVQASGTFGPTTETIVKRFQSDQGLTADGQFGPRSLRAETAVTAALSVIQSSWGDWRGA